MVVILPARSGATVSAERMMALENRLERLEGKIARGVRFTEPAEDPAGHLRASLLARLDARLVAEQRTIDRASTRLSRAEVAMAESDQVLQRLRELAILGRTGSLSGGDRQVIAVEVRGFRAQLFDLANSRDDAGRHLFAGALDGAPAYVEDETGAIVWQGFGRGPGADAAGIAGTGVPPGPDLFGADETGAFAAIDQLLAALEEPDEQLRGPAMEAALAKLEAAHDRIVGARARTGTALARLERETERVAQARLAAAESLAATRGLDLTAALAELEALRLALSAAQAVFPRIHGTSLFDRLG